jgi:hypothetical protein
MQIIPLFEEKKYDLDKAALLLSKKMPKSAGIDLDGYKYGAFSYEPWEELAEVMKAVGVTTKAEVNSPGWLDELSAFMDKLKKAKLIYVEW